MFRPELLGSIHQSNRETFGPYPDIQMIRFSGRIHFIDGAAAAVQKVPSGCVDTAVTGIVVPHPTQEKWEEGTPRVAPFSRNVAAPGNGKI